MSRALQFASRFLHVVVKHLPAESQPWGRAILREMDFIQSPWSLLSWSIGGACALFVYSVRLQLSTFFQETLGDIKRSGPKQTIVGLLWGLGIAGILLGSCVLGYSALLHIPRLQQRWDRVIDAGLIFLLPEAAYLLAISQLWPRRRSAAIGILLAAAILFTHVVFHHVAHI